MSLYDLPEDVVVNFIFEYCYVGDLYVLRKTCMKFCRYINDHYTEDEHEGHDSSSPFSLIHFPNPIDDRLDMKWFAGLSPSLIFWASEDGCPMSSWFLEEISSLGRINILKRLCPRSISRYINSMLISAVSSSRFNTIKWLWPQRTSDIFYDERILSEAIRAENFKIVRWLVKKGLKITSAHVDTSLVTGNISIIVWIHTFIKFSGLDFPNFMYHSKVSSLEWLINNDYPVDLNIVKKRALRYDRDHVLNWLKDKKGFIFTVDDLQICSSSNWLRKELGCETLEEKMIDLSSIKYVPKVNRRHQAAVFPWRKL